jgi:hypothetical protein
MRAASGQGGGAGGPAGAGGTGQQFDVQLQVDLSSVIQKLLNDKTFQQGVADLVTKGVLQATRNNPGALGTDTRSGGVIPRSTGIR